MNVLVRAGPIEPVLLIGGNVDRVPRLHLHHSVLELKVAGTSQNHDEFMLGVVEPDAFGRIVSRADDPFDPEPVLLENGREFLGRLARSFIFTPSAPGPS